MRLRFAYTLTLLFALAGVASAEPPSPAIVVQTKPVSRLLADYRELLRQVGGPAQGEKLVKEFEDDLKETLGDNGFEGLDINRPIAAYSDLKNKLEESGLVLVVPVTSEKDFLAFLGRIKIKAVPVEGKKDLYELDLPDDEVFLQSSHLRFVEGGLAYLTLNDGEPTDAKKLIPHKDLVDLAEPALVAVKLYPGRVPAKLVTNMLEEFEQGAAALKMLLGAAQGEGKVLKAALEHGPKLVRRYAETWQKEASEIDAKFSFDPVTGDTLTELTLVPKPGTALAKEIAATKATTNRFAGLVTKDAAFSVVVKAPLFAKELREIGAAIFEGEEEQVNDTQIPEKLKPIVGEALKGIARTVKSDDLDAALVLTGPDATGKFTLLAGVTFNDPSGIEKALRALAKDADFAKEFEFNVAKVGSTGVHKAPLYRVLPEGAVPGFEKVFGDKPLGAVAFEKDAVFVAVGPGAVEAVKAALEAKAGPAPAFDVSVNMDRFHKMLEPNTAKIFAKHMGNADKTVNVLRVTVDGGTKLTVKAMVNARVLPRAVFAGESSNQTFEKVGEKVK